MAASVEPSVSPALPIQVKAAIAGTLLAALAKDARLTLPEAQAAPIVIPKNAKALQIVATLPEAAKLAPGVHIGLAVFISHDDGDTWQFLVGCDWDSYGPNGRRGIASDGQIADNPDLYLTAPAVPGGIFRVEVTAKDDVQVALAVSALS